MSNKMEKLVRHTLAKGLDDWVPMASVESSIRAYYRSARNIKSKTLECMRIMVDEGYSEIGWIGTGGFQVSDLDIDDLFKLMADSFSDPGTGFSHWLRNTKKGDSYALLDENSDY